ncbi:BZ3500_MvSof-1268-A1-R1_Chr2-1g04679 [Microbotryum saponariae]|uniref:BZ3500_MvSof-1268-A1-R1_Chr2-1g04679 protein n=1 Tax=Microbotryum saponariae TaxID=289078 RepID=A0A2X0L9C1_9BASI|nr:BZ3500_MvSof-1268-A1-R1_Chr2-1g04679 [Microbotryum saponariae]SCZ92303.1 BZ3501_MvSof-1269-A2-R1_Chr2-1g04335 [Microbotryum saponariae]
MRRRELRPYGHSGLSLTCFAVFLSQSTSATKKPRLSRDRASVQQRAIVQARREHLDNTLAVLQQKHEDLTDRMIGHLDRAMLSDLVTYLANLKTRWKPDWSAASEIIVEARSAKEAAAFYGGNHKFDLPLMMHPMQ